MHLNDSAEVYAVTTQTDTESKILENEDGSTEMNFAEDTTALKYPEDMVVDNDAFQSMEVNYSEENSELNYAKDTTDLNCADDSTEINYANNDDGTEKDVIEVDNLNNTAKYDNSEPISEMVCEESAKKSDNRKNTTKQDILGNELTKTEDSTDIENSDINVEPSGENCEANEDFSLEHNSLQDPDELVIEIHTVKLTIENDINGLNIEQDSTEVCNVETTAELGAAEASTEEAMVENTSDPAIAEENTDQAIKKNTSEFAFPESVLEPTFVEKTNGTAIEDDNTGLASTSDLVFRGKTNNLDELKDVMEIAKLRRPRESTFTDIYTKDVCDVKNTEPAAEVLTTSCLSDKTKEFNQVSGRREAGQEKVNLGLYVSNTSPY